jgi:hypothetical protein
MSFYYIQEKSLGSRVNLRRARVAIFDGVKPEVLHGALRGVTHCPVNTGIAKLQVNRMVWSPRILFLHDHHTALAFSLSILILGITNAESNSLTWISFGCLLTHHYLIDPGLQVQYVRHPIDRYP